MRIKFNKELEFLLKKYLIPEKILLKKRLNRAIKDNYEEELKVLEKIVQKDYESVDVGVYRGVYTYRLSQLSKHVHSFEPNPIILPYLEKNLKKIIKNMTLYKIALSDRSIDTDLKVPKRIKKINIDINEEKYKLGCATIHKKNYLGEDEFEIYKTKTERLDNLLLKKKIGFIKIDVEGHEKNVILGSKEVIKKNKPNLLVEIEERHSSEKVEETINFINGLGYKSYYVEKEILKSTKKLVNYSYKNNFIFLS